VRGGARADGTQKEIGGGPSSLRGTSLRVLGEAPTVLMPDSDALADATAVVVAGDEETRVLLRGLLRLHHFRVLGEAEGCSQAVQLIQERRPSLLMADVSLSEGSIQSLIRDARNLTPTLRIVLVAPASRPPPVSDAKTRPDAILLRPFRIHQFADALSPRAGNPPGPTQDDPSPSSTS
jgi:CheY-like chemotaxis protein